MNNGKIFYNNLIGQCTLTTTPTASATGFGVENLYNSNPGVVWRSQTTAEHAIKMTFSSKTIVKAIAVLNHNLVSQDTLVFEAAKNQDFSGDKASATIDSTVGYKEIPWSETDWNVIFSYTGIIYYRLRVSKTSGSYIQIGEIYLAGSTYSFERNFKWSYSYTREINRNSRQTTSGQVYRSTRYIRRGFDLEFEGMSDTQKQTFETIANSDYICLLPYDSDGDLYYGTLDFSSFTHVYNNYWNASFNFMENPK